MIRSIIRGGICAIAALSIGASTQTLAIGDFVRQTFAHGVPFDEVAGYPATDVQPQLIAMLASTSDRTAWPNVATVLGMIGDARVAASLIDFVQRGDGAVDVTEYNAKTNALFGLGYLLNRTRDQQVLVYLTAGRSPFSESGDRRNLQLTLTAIRALGISGTEEAAAALGRVQTLDTAALDALSRRVMSATIKDALRANQQVRATGLPRYLSRSR
ncbi:MAG: hypothetical protein DMF91_02670 [Acidobacteria bacterium]|nr:MAG: hypothetical protein DMF91_02670 [Acidobacteriota bacterium]